MFIVSSNASGASRGRCAIKILKFSLLAVFFLFPVFRAATVDLKLNQFFVAGKAISRHSFSVFEIAQSVYSYYSFGFNNLLNYKSAETLDYKEPIKLFDYLWKRFPSYAIVYPTETYYYYTLKVQDKNIAGNIRLLDLNDGVLHMGYFDKSRPAGTSTNSWSVDISSEDGLHVEVVSDFEYEVTYKRKTITFVLTDFVSEIPQSLKLNSNEKFLAQIFDESGVRLVLVFNTKNNTFYYLVNQDVVLNDHPRSIGNNFYYGIDTGFLYYKDNEDDRIIFVGVSSKNVSANNYFDGPFDQVPPRLSIREELLSAYPSLRTDPNRVIDDHGNYKNDSSRRVAISAYSRYQNPFSLKRSLEKKCKGQSILDLSSCFTRKIK